MISRCLQGDTMSSFDKEIYEMRKKDIITGIILIIVAVGMGVKALTYPLNESYAGVENAWYASPAFFPLIVSALILLLSMVLLGNAVKYIINNKDDSGKSDNAIGKGNEIYSIIGLLLTFIYLYIPSTDFLIAGILFLSLLVALYTIPKAIPKVPIVLAYIALGLIFRITFEIFAADNWSIQYIRDYILTLVYVLFSIFSYFSVKKNYQEKKRWLIVFIPSLIFMIFLVFSFKLGLRIPMPREGFYCYQIDILF